VAVESHLADAGRKLSDINTYMNFICAVGEDRKQGSKPSPGWLSAGLRRVGGLTNEQKVYVGIIGIILLILIPRILLVAVVGVERVIVGGILVAEQGIVAALRTLASFFAVLAIGALAFKTIASFMKPRSR